MFGMDSRCTRSHPKGICSPGGSLAKSKAFLFFGATDAMVKLRESLPEAARLEAEQPARYTVGAHGWVKAMFGPDDPPAFDVFERWIDESYQIVVGAAKPVAKRPAAKKPAAKKPAAKKAAKKPARRRAR
jgi:hypothetical protein